MAQDASFLPLSYNDYMQDDRLLRFYDNTDCASYRREPRIDEYLSWGLRKTL